MGVTADFPNINPGGDFASIFEELRKAQDSTKGPLLSPAALLARIPPSLLPRAGQSQTTSGAAPGAASQGNLGGVTPGSNIPGVGTTQTQSTPFVFDDNAKEVFRRIFGGPVPETPTQDQIDILLKYANPRGSDASKNAPNPQTAFGNIQSAAAAQSAAQSVQSNGGGFDSGSLAALLAALAGGAGGVSGGSQLFPTLGGR